MDPNLNAEIYRNMTSADIPPNVDRHLQFILVSDGIGAILGASNMTDRYWNGTVWYYKDHTDFNRDKATTAMKTESGVCDGACLSGTNKFVICEDSGVLQILSINEMADTHNYELQCLGYSFEHDDAITSVSAFDTNTRLVTGGMDYCVKVWDTVEMYSSHTFSPAHTDTVTCVQAQPKSIDIFASISLDHDALLWDLRQQKPASCIIKNVECGLTAAAWNPKNVHELVIGDADGRILVLDVRQSSSEPVFQNPRAFSRGVYRLLFNPARNDQFAGCCDSTEVKVFDTSNNMEVIYENKNHRDFVRGLAWDQNCLLTASWDNTVLEHAISS
ncbi:methylosome protein 50 [Neodiprion fabricii]|uniref:methylosome protein 50 n=1 Tax=Neodiprion fabricii TaxID=2872261 RepID=UPI001ED8FBEB|nr:methylosome protein 50 [Neodiprion fabricii]